MSSNIPQLYYRFPTNQLQEIDVMSINRSVKMVKLNENWGSSSIKMDFG